MFASCRQFLEEEKQRKAAGEAAKAAAGAAGAVQQHVVPVEPKMRCISQADFKEAMKQVGWQGGKGCGWGVERNAWGLVAERGSMRTMLFLVCRRGAGGHALARRLHGPCDSPSSSAMNGVGDLECFLRGCQHGGAQALE